MPTNLEYNVEIETRNGAATFVVKFEKELTKEWLSEWKSVFHDISTIENHAKHIVSMLILFPAKIPHTLNGYGPLRYTGLRTWELIILSGNGKEENRTEIERLPTPQTKPRRKKYARRKKNR
jgi:hypothetical protein